MRRIIYFVTVVSTILFTATCCGKNGGQEDDGKQDPPKEETVDFAKGADVSWITEMEADGRKFYSTDGKETEFFALIKSLGMDAVRLRVWVNPAKSSYAADWSAKDDFVAKAVRADKAGLKIMVDFHYSDFFADPGRQTMPVDWADKSYEQLKTAVADHTKDVLNALKNKGITPLWIQIGNETRNGMMWPWGQLWDSGDNKGAKGWASFVGLYNAGYDAAKSIFADAKVMPHLNHAYEDNIWWVDDFKKNGGKLDMIAFSHYPQVDKDGMSWQTANITAVNSIKSLVAKHGLDVMIAEIGVKNSSADAKQIMEDFFTRIKDVSNIKGVFYWEPECDGVWKPACYQTLKWNAYDMGAFTSDGKPGPALDVFVK